MTIDDRKALRHYSKILIEASTAIDRIGGNFPQLPAASDHALRAAQLCTDAVLEDESKRVA